MSTSDNQLLARCRRGNVQAWGELMDRYYDPVARFVFQVGPSLNRPEVEEICEEVFVTSVNRVEEVKKATSIRCWLIEAASAVARARAEREAAENAARAADDEGQKEPYESLPTPPDTPIHGVQAPDAAGGRKLRNLLDELREPCRDLLELYYFGDFTPEELGQFFAIEPETVPTRLFKCLWRLEVLDREMDCAREEY